MSDTDRTIQFGEAYTPPISAGQGPYTLTVTQTITELGADHSSTDLATYTSTKTVHVRGERFSIDPLDIAAMCPPDGSEGDYARVLPHITFSRKTLPWEQESGIQGAPWLALLVFHESDPGGIPHIRPAMVGDLSRAPFRPGSPPSVAERPSTLVAGIATYADAAKAAGRSWTLRPGEEVWDPCLVVDVPVALFQAMAPAQDDLRWLAHSRMVSPAPTPECSAILANRLPMSGGLSVACLVSLEGMAALLGHMVGGAYETPTLKANDQSATHVRLVVLKAWSFRGSLDLQGFNRPLSTGPLSLPYTEPRPAAATPEDARVKNILAMGYTALEHNTRWGDRTISWYRGPFLPFNSEVTLSVPRPPLGEDGYLTGILPLSTADEALRYDPELGMLDVSYAAAWQLGRLMALGDKIFAYDLYQWKREIRRKIIDISTETGAADAANAFAVLAELLKPALDYLASVGAKPPADSRGGGNARAQTQKLNPMQSTRRLMNDLAKLKEILKGAKAPASVVNRLERLRRLEGVPVDYLVPDERMLPPESLRFFQVDLNWIYSLIEGAYSVARVSTGDETQDAATCPHDTYHQISGFLLRSAIVSGWPGLQVLVDISNPSAAYTVLRCERLTPDILLYLVEVEGPGIMTSVTFQVPPESIEFHLPKSAPFRDRGQSVADVDALAQALAQVDKVARSAAEFARQLATVVRPVLTWNSEREVLAVSITRAPGMDQYAWQFLVNNRPFGQPVPFTVSPTGPTLVEVQVPLVDDLPAGEIAVRVRSAGPPPGGMPGVWVRSTTLHRPPAYDVQPVLGYHVGEDSIAAEWPASRDSVRLTAQLLSTSPWTQKSSAVGAVVKVDFPRAVLTFDEHLPPGQVQVRFRSMPATQTDSATLPGVWGASTQVLTRLGRPTSGGSETSYVDGALTVLFFGEDPSGLVEVYLTTSERSLTNPICTLRGTGQRVVVTVKSGDAPPGWYRVMARVIGRENHTISSPVMESGSPVVLLGRPLVTVSYTTGEGVLSWSRIDDAVFYRVVFKSDQGNEYTALVDASPAPRLDLGSQRLPPGLYRGWVQALGARDYVWSGPVSDPATVTITS